MASSSSRRSARHAKASHKPVTLHRHHTRPYRKRHVVLLLSAVAALVILSSVIVMYRDDLISGLSGSRSFVSDLFVQSDTYNVEVESSYGFALTFDQKKFYASGISDQTGNVSIGAELAEPSAYSVVRVAPTFTDAVSKAKNPSSMTVTFHPERATAKDVPELVALKDAGLDEKKLSKTMTVITKLGNQTFKKTSWQSISSDSLNASIRANFVTYAAVIRGNIVTVVINLGVGDGNEQVYEAVLQSLTFEPKISGVAVPTKEMVAKVQNSRSLLDTLTNTRTAAATFGVDLSGSEKVAALYSPAVVKLYNSYCMDIVVDDKVHLKDSCDAVTGSAFFVSQDGYLATNGHVAAISPLDIIIDDALTTYSTTGDPTNFNFVIGLTGLTTEDLPSDATAVKKLAIMVDAMYDILPSRVVASNSASNLLIQVTPKNPNLAALLQASKDRKAYVGDKSVITAKLIADDYLGNDGYDGFRASDAAIIKVSGTNFPVVRLGSVDSAVQGSNLSILGYPGSASNNVLVDSTTSQATLTTGKVAAKKKASHSDKILIETDTTIGHGNSGGPALSDNGEVVGIATYTADGTGTGSGTFNYVRDIKDLTDLAADSEIIFDTDSATQQEWEQGIAYFYSSYYSKALLSFRNVEASYPNHSRVAEFIRAAEKRVANGEDIVDFPVVPVFIASSAALLVIVISIMLMARHHKKHKIYLSGVAQGSVVPSKAGGRSQKVFVTPKGVRVDSPLPLATAPSGTPSQSSNHKKSKESE